MNTISPHTEAIIGRVRYLMELRRLSQRQLAILLRIDTSNLSKVLNGKLPFSEGLVNRIVADLGVSKSWLRDGEGLPFDKTLIAKEIHSDAAMPRLQGQQGIPVYDLDVTAGCRSLDDLFGEIRPVGAIDIPGIPQNSNIVKVRETACRHASSTVVMWPYVPSGTCEIFSGVKSMWWNCRSSAWLNICAVMPIPEW